MMNRNGIIGLLCVLFSAGVYYLLPNDLSEPARRMSFIFTLAALFWAFEVLDIWVTSLLVVLLRFFSSPRLATLFPLAHLITATL